jgi:hypothetical protein
VNKQNERTNKRQQTNPDNQGWQGIHQSLNNNQKDYLKPFYF